MLNDGTMLSSTMFRWDLKVAVVCEQLHALVARSPLAIGQRIEHDAFWHQFSTEKTMDRVHASRAARRTA